MCTIPFDATMDEKKMRVEPDVHATDGHGNTALFRAISSGDEAAVRACIAAGADVNHLSHRHETPLYYACECSSVSMVRLLLDHGARSDVHGSKSVLVAAVRGDGGGDVVRLLRARQCAELVSDRDAKFDALHIAALEGNVDAYMELLHCPGERRVCAGGWTDLHFAAWSGSAAACRAILGHRPCAIDARDDAFMTPLHLACTRPGNHRVVRLLMHYGANVNVRNEFGHTALDMAVDCFAYDCVEALLAVPGCHATRTLRRYLFADRMDAVYAVLRAGADPFVENEEIHSGSFAQWVEFELKYRPSVERYERLLASLPSFRRARRPAHAHIAPDEEYECHVLRDVYDIQPRELPWQPRHNMFANMRPHQWVPSSLRSACCMSRAHVYAKHGRADLLARCSAPECGARDGNDGTPLMMASGMGHLGAVRCLLRKGANANDVNAKGRNALYFATYYDRRDVFDELVLAGSSFGAPSHPSAAIYASIEGDDPGGELFRRLVRLGQRFALPEFVVTTMTEEDEEKAIWMLRVGFEGSLDSTFDRHRTLLHVAAKERCAKMVRYLVEEMRVDVRATDRYGKTALYYAAESGCQDVIAILSRDDRGV